MKNILIIITVAATLVSCGKFQEPVGYITVPIYSSDIEKYNNGTINNTK